MSDLAECLFTLPEAHIPLIVVEGEVVKHEHLLGAVGGNEAAKQVTVAL